MINRRRGARMALAACAAVAAAWLPGTSAQAADGPVVHIDVLRDEVGLPVPPDTDDPPQISWGLVNDGPGTAEDVTVSMDLSEVASWVTVNGKAAQDVYTWPTMDAVPEGDNAGYLADLNAKPGTPLGTTGTVTLSGTSANGTVVSTTVQLTAGTTELKVNKLTDRAGDKPGSTIETPVTISNTGTLPAEGVQLRLLTTAGLSYADRFANCVYSTVSPDPAEYDATRQALCTFDTVVEPGKSYRLDQPVGLDVTDQALFEFFDDQALPLTGAAPPAGDGPRLSLVAAGDATGDVTASGRQKIDADNTADMVAGGDTAEGAPGDTVYVDVSLGDQGPARVDYSAGDDQPALLLTVPTGTEAVEIPDRCSVWDDEAKAGTGERTPGAPQYLCNPSPRVFEAGDTRTFRFGLKIRANAGTTTGEARATTAYGNTMTFDDRHDNDTAAVTVEVEGGGTDPSASASASPSTAAAAGDGNDPRAQTVSDAAATGSLAGTGASGVLPVAAATGAGALLLGGALVLLVRRRRS
ncbi:hypothetical protein ACYF6T_17380 [Streptomyces sp. 7R007]